MADVVVFAGPSAAGLPAACRGRKDLQWRPPVRRGDIDSLVRKRSRAIGVIVICDGVFQSAPAVSHAEICRALDAGWRVWGVSSMGAIRAHELRFEGMKGHGYVHAQFSKFDDFTDDEMGLLHFPDPPYFQVSEALVNVRYALECLAGPMGMAPAAAAQLIGELRRLWFGDRTEARLRELLTGTAGLPAPKADALLAWLRTHRIKNLDLLDLLACRPWQD